MIRVRTGPEFPEDNLRELTTQIVGYPGREKTKNSPTKGSNLMHSLALSQNKGLSDTNGELARCTQVPPPPQEAERQASDSQSWKAKGYSILSPRNQHPPTN